ncbi:MAG TPA: DUF559 domain-containing protein [Burkholderiales bacterium]|jgi:very-short-patch-repair endonuclease|nr:DUF559 domain-containing protein [Burkholderiales bacterium]
MKGQTSKSTRRVSVKLRHTMTDAENKLWWHLQGERLGVKFRRQHPYRKFVLDFVCLERTLVVEVDGSQHAEQQAADKARTALLEQAGFRVLRFWNNEVLNQLDDVLEEICRVLAEREGRNNGG